jgi:hypothetical protein
LTKKKRKTIKIVQMPTKIKKRFSARRNLNPVHKNTVTKSLIKKKRLKKITMR